MNSPLTSPDAGRTAARPSPLAANVQPVDGRAASTADIERIKALVLINTQLLRRQMETGTATASEIRRICTVLNSAEEQICRAANAVARHLKNF